MNHDRHVKALYELSLEHKQVSQMYQTLEALNQALTKEVILYLDAPTVLYNEKVSFFDTFNKPKETHAFLLILLKKKRIHEFPTFFKHMTHFIQHINSDVIVDVFVANPLSKTEETHLSSSLKTFLKANQVILKTHIDTSVIGGIKLQYQGKALDYSVVHTLDHMKTTI
jgi:F-type H+-transporting ATPase subunit delta